MRWLLLIVTTLVAFAWAESRTVAHAAEDLLAEGQDALYRMDYALAAKLFGRLARENPSSPVGLGMLSIAAWNELLLAAGSPVLDDYATPTVLEKTPGYRLESAKVRRAREKFEETNQALLDWCERALQNNPRNTLALYFKGVAYENFAAEAVVITKASKFEIKRYANQAKETHELVLKLDPNFVDAYLSLATHEFARATLPFHYKLLVFLLGQRGSKARAFERLELVGNKGKYRRLDARVVLALFNVWKGDSRKAIAIFEKLQERYPENYLLDLNLAAIYETALNLPLRAVEVYRRLERNLSRKAPGLQAGEVYYRMGRAAWRARNYDQALRMLGEALHSAKGEPQTEPLVCELMARIHEEQGSVGEAAKWYRRVLQHRGVPGIAEEVARAERKARP